MNPFKILKDKFMSRWERKQDEKKLAPVVEDKPDENIRKHKPTKPGAQAGAFGHCHNMPSNAQPLSPAGMRARYGKVVKA